MPTSAWWKRVQQTKGKEGRPYQFEGYLLSDMVGIYPYQSVSTTVTWTEVTN